jgi:hypothetical protein
MGSSLLPELHSLREYVKKRQGSDHKKEWILPLFTAFINWELIRCAKRVFPSGIFRILSRDYQQSCCMQKIAMLE